MCFGVHISECERPWCKQTCSSSSFLAPWIKTRWRALCMSMWRQDGKMDDRWINYLEIIND